MPLALSCTAKSGAIMKLFSIGDSITQGFMSGAAARTHLAYPSLIAKAMGLTTGSAKTDDFRIPEWPQGLPIDLEGLARRLRKKIGGEIDFWDWPHLANVIRDYMDDVEDHYERGEGRLENKFGTLDYFHNVAYQGADVADAWMVTPKLCYEQIRLENGRKPVDPPFASPSASFYRTALNVLNPLRDPAKDDWSALKWLDYHATKTGIENTTLWLGANNALGTVIKLKLIPTLGNDSGYHKELSRPERDNFNLWAPHHFREDYEDLMAKIDAIMKNNKDTNWRVFIGTVPAVSIAPITTGVGEPRFITDPFEIIGFEDEKGQRIPYDGRKAQYFKYYTYFLFDEKTAHTTPMKLTFSQVVQIDTFIAEYNKIIKAIVADYNKAHKQERYVVVDTCRMLLKAAYKRNNYEPTYDWPDEVRWRTPMVDTRFHHAEKGDRTLEQGGLFSLDGIHPTAIGQGMIAREFIGAIEAVRGKLPKQLDWDAIYKSDTLYSQPIEIMGSIRRKAEDIAKFLVWAVQLKGRGSARNL